MSRLQSDVQQMRSTPARHDFRELLVWYRGTVLPALADVRGVTMTDIDERRNAIIVGVATQAQVPVVEQLLRALPVPSSAIIVQQQDAQQPQSGGHLSPLAKSTQRLGWPVERWK